MLLPAAVHVVKVMKIFQVTKKISGGALTFSVSKDLNGLPMVTGLAMRIMRDKITNPIHDIKVIFVKRSRVTIVVSIYTDDIVV
jgi:hypothetical protein